MPTLLSVNNYYYYRGGAETVFLEHNRMFAERGWTVVPFSMTHPKNLPSPWAEYFVDEIEFGSSYTLAERLVRVPKAIYSFEARRKLGRLLDAVRPDVCHAHNVYHHISPSILGLLKRRGVPVLLTLHDLKIACPAYSMLSHDGVCERCRGGRIYNVAVHRCLKGSLALSTIAMIEAALHATIGSYRRCVDRFVVPSRFFIEKLVEWGFPRASFAHVPNFIDLGRFEPDYTPGPAFLYVGRLSREKGLPTLVRAAAAAKVRVLLAGTGPEAAELTQLIRDTGADVELLGHLSGVALWDAYRAARAIVLPSECYENAPMSILEAYALGKPVVGARIGGVPELIREGETGMGFQSGDVDSLAAALRAMASRSEGDLSAMGRAGRRWVETEFTANLYQQRVLDLYATLGVRDGLVGRAGAPV